MERTHGSGREAAVDEHPGVGAHDPGVRESRPGDSPARDPIVRERALDPDEVPGGIRAGRRDQEARLSGAELDLERRPAPKDLVTGKRPREPELLVGRGGKTGPRALRRANLTGQESPEILMPTVVFVNEGKAGIVPSGTTLLRAAVDLGVHISHVCGGNGICSTCRVEVVAGGENLTAINPQEIAYDLGSGRRLGCQARVLGNVGVRVLMVPKVEMD